LREKKKETHKHNRKGGEKERKLRLTQAREGKETSMSVRVGRREKKRKIGARNTGKRERTTGNPQKKEASKKKKKR